LDKGADANEGSNDDGTALMWADLVWLDPNTGLPKTSAADDEIKIVKLLLARGADIYAVNTHGQTALDLARIALKLFVDLITRLRG